MPCSGAAGGSFFVGCVRDLLVLAFGRDDEARERDDDRVLEAIPSRYPRATVAPGATRERASARLAEVAAADRVAARRNREDAERRRHRVDVEHLAIRDAHGTPVLVFVWSVT